MFELAMHKDEVKARLVPIPVYTVANPKNEFVLVAGEVRLIMCTAACWSWAVMHVLSCKYLVLLPRAHVSRL
jgi:hypothetical protein